MIEKAIALIGTILYPRARADGIAGGDLREGGG